MIHSPLDLSPDPRFPFESATRLALRNLVNAVARESVIQSADLKAADRAARDVLDATYLEACGYILIDESRYSGPFPFLLKFQEPGREGWHHLSRHKTREAWKKAGRKHNDERLAAMVEAGK